MYVAKTQRAVLAFLAFILTFALFAEVAGATGLCSGTKVAQNQKTTYTCIVAGKSYTSSSSGVSACKNARSDITKALNIKGGEKEYVKWLDTFAPSFPDSSLCGASGSNKKVCTGEGFMSYIAYYTKWDVAGFDGSGNTKYGWVNDTSKSYPTKTLVKKTFTWTCAVPIRPGYNG